jgi:hypothetical protein
MAVDAAEIGGLANGFAAGGAGLSDLPEEGPEGQAQRSGAGAGVRAFILLAEEVMGKPALEEPLELMQEGIGGTRVAGLQPPQFVSEVRSPFWEVRRHRTAVILSY